MARSSMPRTPSGTLSPEEVAWVENVARQYDALVFHWVGPLTGSYFFLLPGSVWRPARKAPQQRRSAR